ncbi:MAG: hypothetical protein NDJ75_07385, partial [Thermoanaerobaculia bacterium]|nr:hypothetical protein [Thermoanaerobaculia bacterium]
MEAHEHEPSYYEVALTNRQVVTGFVLLLVCLFVAFLSGVWLGQGSGGSTAAAAPAGGATPEAGSAKLEQLSFFGGSAASAPAVASPAAAPPASTPPPRAAPPAPVRAAPTPAEVEAEKLRQTLEAEMAQHRTDLAAAETPAAAPAPAGTRVRRETAA